MEIIFIFLPVLTLIIGYFLGYDDSYVQRQNTKPLKEEEKIHLSQAEAVKQEKKPAKQLGAINRPTVEELERKEHPKIVEEEKAWDESMEHVMSLFNTPYLTGVTHKQ